MIEYRAVFFGALALVASYLSWALLATLLATFIGMSVPTGAWFLLSLVGAAGPVVAGYVAARSAHSRKVMHGILASVLGAAFILAALGAFTGQLELYGLLGALIASAVLSLVGALVASRRSAPAGP